MSLVTFVLTAMLAGWIGDQARDAAAPAAPATASIAGTLVTDETNAVPVRRARVTLAMAGDARKRTTVTDDAGRFEFSGLPAASVLITASRVGYVDASYGATRSGRAGTPIALADGQHVTNLVVRIMRGAVIDGTIRDASGEPASASTVSLRQYRIVNGERTLAPVYSLADNRTDDRGHYRLFGLAPGEYFVSVDPPSLGPQGRTIHEVTAAEIARASAPGRAAGQAAAPEAKPRPVVMAPVYFPGTALLSSATAVRVAAGEEHTGVDFRLEFVPAATVSGSISWTGLNGDPGLNVQVRLATRANTGGAPTGTTAARDGTFRIAGVPPGVYQLTAEGRVGAGRAGAAGAAPPAAPPAGRTTWWASTEVVVDGRDVAGLALALDFAPTVSGRVVFEGTPPPPQTLTSGFVQFFDDQMGVLWTRASIEASGAFVEQALRPGTYRVSALIGANPTSSAGWSVKSATLAGRDVADAPLDVRPGQDLSDLVITLTDRLTELAGSLKDNTGRAATAYFIVVFSSNRDTWRPQSRWIAQTRPDNDGHFSVKGLPPGDYLIAALTDVEPGEWFNPAFLDSLKPSATAVTLAEGEKKVQNLAIK